MKGIELNQGIKQVAAVVVLAFVFCLIIVELNYFISSLLGAFTLYMLLRKPLHKLEAKGWNTTIATIFFIIIATLIIILIGGIFAGTIYLKMKDFQPQIVIENIHHVREFILAKTGYNIMEKDVADETIQAVAQMLPGIFSVTGSIVTNALMMILVLFFMLQQSRAMEKGIEDHLPLSHNSIALLKHETQNVVISNAIGIPVIMTVHALVSTAGYWISGVGEPFVWGVITGLGGLIPVIGTGIIWIPMSIDLIITGEVWPGIFLLLYGIIVISSADNLVRMFFMKKYADVHPLITIFGVILGMNLFGFWGIIFGPLVISGFWVLLKIYKNEFLEN